MGYGELGTGVHAHETSTCIKGLVGWRCKLVSILTILLASHSKSRLKSSSTISTCTFPPNSSLLQRSSPLSLHAMATRAVFPRPLQQRPTTRPSPLQQALRLTADGRGTTEAREHVEVVKAVCLSREMISSIAFCLVNPTANISPFSSYTGTADAVFILKKGAKLRNCIIGKNQKEGVHCDGPCTLEFVWFEDGMSPCYSQVYRHVLI